MGVLQTKVNNAVKRDIGSESGTGEGLWHEKPCEVVEIQHMSLCAHFSSDEDFRKRLQSYILRTFEPYGFNR